MGGDEAGDGGVTGFNRPAVDGLARLKQGRIQSGVEDKEGRGQ